MSTTTSPSPKPPIPLKSLRRLSSCSSPRRPRSPTVAMAPLLPTIPQSDSPPPLPPPTPPSCVPSPLRLASIIAANHSHHRHPSDYSHSHHHRTTSNKPLGPRGEPAPSVLKNIMALRRMNSEVSCAASSRASQRYVHLGREASPSLPWMGIGDLACAAAAGASCQDLFDLDLDLPTAASSEGAVDADCYVVGYQYPPQGVDVTGFGGAGGGAVVALPDHEGMADDGGDDETRLTESTTMWEDMERFWNPNPTPRKAAAGAVVPMVTTPFSFRAATAAGTHSHGGSGNGSSSSSVAGVALTTPIPATATTATTTSPMHDGLAGTLDPRVLTLKTPIAASLGSPRSLYDAQGFLKT